MPFRPFRPAVAGALLLACLGSAQAQDSRDDSFFGQLFGGSERFGGERSGAAERAGGDRYSRDAPQLVQASPSDLVVRLDRLENQIRQLTGQVEQLQFRNQQLEQQLRGMLGAGAAVPPAPPPPGRPQAGQPAPPLGSPGGPPGRRSDAFDPADNPGAPGAVRSADNNTSAIVPGGARPPLRRDVFDPNENPNAPGAPRVLGSIPGAAPGGSPGVTSGSPVPSGPSVIRGEPDEYAGPPIGAPGGRQAGAPLDLSTLSSNPANDPTLGAPAQSGAALPPPPPRNPNATGTYQLQAAAPATTTPKQEYDAAYGYMVRKDYAVAEDGFRNFLRRNPSDRLAGDANYWLGETLFQRQRYREAAESFLTVSTKFEKSAKAADALVRLGQSLAALKEKEAACATFSEVVRKYPRASPSVKQSVDREQKRVGC